MQTYTHVALSVQTSNALGVQSQSGPVNVQYMQRIFSFLPVTVISTENFYYLFLKTSTYCTIYTQFT